MGRTCALLLVVLMTCSLGPAQEIGPAPQTPQGYPDPLLWLPTAYLQHLKKDVLGGDTTGAPNSATTSGDLIGQIDEAIFGHRPVAGTASSMSTAMRPVLYGDATQSSALTFGASAHTGFAVQNSAGDFNRLHSRLPWTIGFKIRPHGAGPGTILGTATGNNTALTGVGMMLGINSGNRFTLRVYDSASRSVFGGVTGTAMTTNSWYSIIFTSDGSTVTLYQTPYGGATTTATNTTGSYATITNGINTSASAWLVVGNNPDDSQYLNAELADLFITNSVLPASYRTAFNNYNPARIATTPAIYIRARDTVLRPGDVLPCWGHYDASVVTGIKKFDKTTQVTATGDDVGRWPNLVGGGYLSSRDFTVLTKRADNTTDSTSVNCPAWKVSQVNGLPALYYNGTDSLEQNLSMFPSGLTRGDFSMFVVVKLDASVSGSGPPSGGKRGAQFFTIGGGGTQYMGVVGQGDGDPDRVFYHTSDDAHSVTPETTIDGSLSHVNGNPVVIETTRQNLAWKIWMNGIQRAVSNGAGSTKYNQTIVEATPSAGNWTYSQLYNLGRPCGLTAGSGDDWNMLGNICEIVMYPTALPAELRRRIRKGLSDKWGVPNVNTSSQLERRGHAIDVVDRTSLAA